MIFKRSAYMQTILQGHEERQSHKLFHTRARHSLTHILSSPLCSVHVCWVFWGFFFVGPFHKNKETRAFLLKFAYFPDPQFDTKYSEDTLSHAFKFLMLFCEKRKARKEAVSSITFFCFHAITGINTKTLMSLT